MADMLTLAAAGLVLAWWLLRRRARQDPVRVTIRLDRSGPGAHLIWQIVNGGATPVTLTRLVVHAPGGGATLPLLPETLETGDEVFIPIDADWSLLGARAIAVGDADDHEHPASRRQLAAIQEQLRRHIDRREYLPSARDWLFGAADLAFGVLILGLGFFMLMWMIATG